ncbi:heparinase II/III family protein [Metabacillus sp. GX 13764]|uniref:heparinase II/III domain-containing protein n=1 Tax=Metabacillus kandeliae TaxID=2900151 RepID=UPI001E31964D|nr:heparinase II/III family protein [Metabacillus kandeliae]MCD7035525.1 heparinase II/III family protein [Metabacillus kandeliae]
MMGKKICLLLMLFIVCFLLFPKLSLAAEGEEDTLNIQDFENMNSWRGIVPEGTTVKQGTGAARWNVCKGSICQKSVDISEIPHDWSGYETLDMWVYSEAPVNSRIYAVLVSDNEQTPQQDYYIASLNVTWEGWKKISLPYYSFKKGYSPAGFSKIDQLRFHTSWYGETPNPNMKLVFDQITAGYSPASDELIIDGFEDARKWTSVTEDAAYVKEGLYSGKWQGMDTKKSVQTTAIPKDWSSYDKIGWWMYSEKAANSTIYAILDSDNPETEGLDYYLAGIKLDWTGWKHVTLEKSSFSPSRKPLGFQDIQKITFHSQWYSDQKPDPSAVVYFDELKLMKETFQAAPQEIQKSGIPGSKLTYFFTIQNKTLENDHYEITSDELSADTLSISEPQGDLLPGAKKEISATYTIPAGSLPGDEKDMTISIISRLKLGAKFQVKLSAKTAAYTPSSHQRPKSLVTKAELERAQARISTYQWAKENWNGLKSEADKWLTKNTGVPREPGGHGMWFLCPDSSPLEYNPDSPGRHYCPSDQTFYKGDSYDAGWRYYKHNELIKAARSLAAAYVASKEQKYSDKAASILKEYADLYPNFKKQARGGRLYWQTLDEAVSMVDLAYVYDLLYHSPSLSAADKANIELNLLRPSAKTISEYDMGKSNWQAWHDAAIGVIGSALGDQEMIHFAIDGEHGFHYLMKESVLSDGFWWEGSIAYHMYSLRALQSLADAAESWGIDLYSHPSLKKMYDLPLYYAYPNRGLPFNNDGGTYGTSLLDPVSKKGNFDYEGAFKAYHDPKYAQLLTEKYKITPRAGEYALFKGEDSIPDQNVSDWQSRNFEGAGQGQLRNSSLFALMDYGPYSGSHGHPDKLHLDFFADQEAFAPDFGTPSYGHTLYTGWYKQTVSHNTVTVDGVSQKETEGKLDQFAAGSSLQLMKASADGAYPGVSYTRSLLMWDQMILDIFQGEEKGAIHQYDWVFHGMGETSVSLDLQNRASSPGSRNGYQYVKNPKSAFTGNGFQAEWKLNGKVLKAASLPGSLEEAILAEGPGPSSDPAVLTPVLIERQNGEKAVFEHVFYAGDETLAAEKLDDSTYEITHGNVTDYIFYNMEAGEGQIAAAKVSVFKGKPRPFGNLKVYKADDGSVLNILKSKEILPGASFILKGNVQTAIAGMDFASSKTNGWTVMEFSAQPNNEK